MRAVPGIPSPSKKPSLVISSWVAGEEPGCFSACGSEERSKGWWWSKEKSPMLVQKIFPPLKRTARAGLLRVPPSSPAVLRTHCRRRYCCTLCSADRTQRGVEGRRGGVRKRKRRGGVRARERDGSAVACIHGGQNAQQAACSMSRDTSSEAVVKEKKKKRLLLVYCTHWLNFNQPAEISLFLSLSLSVLLFNTV